MIVKVKELQPAEFAPDATAGRSCSAYHHLAPDPELLAGMLDCGVSCIAYETVTDAQGRLPLLAPMSRIAGRLALQVGRLGAADGQRRQRRAARRRAPACRRPRWW